MPIVDSAIYRKGVRESHHVTLDQTFEDLHEHGGFAWIGLYRPTAEELAAVAEEFELHHLAIQDARTGHQRPKLERYGDILFVVLRPARYLAETEQVEFGEVHLFIGPNFAITVRHAENPDLSVVRRRLEADPPLLALGPQAVLYAVLDEVVDGYEPVVSGMENDIDEIEDELFSNDANVARRIYEVAREAMALQRATHPLVRIFRSLEAGYDKYGVDIELRRDMRDVLDHVLRTVERADTFRALLENALTVHSTLVTQAQNEEMRQLSHASIEQGDQVKKISSWAAILFTPGLVGTVYGMNFTHMPELSWTLGYPMALGMMVASAGLLYWVFKHHNWL
ncbi:magnesium and cobalt transport protein CorA [Glycomyces terrestris]|uniref:Magnesium and cobalt transport protein CorA n=1 Tax=Glycomyces terrestris TaxID=2493553 RepID=A0A426V102_9ACTN|nr:magnesium and cobalt transport protein CorA [Glycomyces terrestris]RRS00579.1 magnesium and cobalt transport protein CorA [Glycomyces terrestris]